jgi:hypothetical protein
VSTPPLPYGQPYQPPPIYPAYQKPVPSRRRPSAWWFVVAGLMMLAGVAIGVLLIVQAVRGFIETDATIQPDGQTHSIVVDTDQDRMVWIDPFEQPVCTIVDAETGTEVEQEGIGNTEYTKSSGGREWTGDTTFDPGSGRLEVTCDASGGPIQIGPTVELGAFVGGLVAGILIPLALGGSGFVLLIVIGVLYATGRPRNVPAPQ